MDAAGKDRAIKHIIWKFSFGDLKERERWDDYQSAYEKAISAPSTATSPSSLFQPTTSGMQDLPCRRLFTNNSKALNIDYPALSDEQMSQ
jgi:polyphosphate kinase 2 (PPK2 family)